MEPGTIVKLPAANGWLAESLVPPHGAARYQFSH